MWAIPTGTSSALKKKKKVPVWSRASKPDSDSPIGSDRESGCDNGGHFMVLNKLLEHGLQRSVLLSLNMVFQAILLIQFF